MRIVAVADTHTFQPDLGVLPNGDVFIHAGDLVRGGSIDQLRPVADWIIGLPHTHKLVVAGNHDWCFLRERGAALELLGPSVRYLEDSCATIEGVNFWGSPWQPTFRNWAFNLPRGVPLAEKWSLIPEDTDVLITHGPPLGFGDRLEFNVHEGCEDLLHAVRRIKPCLHLFGHIHQDGGFWRETDTCFANVTTWECERMPTVIDFDPRTRNVVEVSIPQ